MLFGHNSDVKVGDTVYHVQTEDRGATHAVIDTTVYCRGRVLHRRTDNYKDLLPLDASREESLRKRIDDQHRNVSEEIRSGTLQLASETAPAKAAPAAQAKPAAASPANSPAAELTVELVNAKGWLSGKRANLQVAVHTKHNAKAVAGARVTARIDGAESAAEFHAQTQADGHAHLEFEMPKLSGAEPALVIEASQAGAKACLKFQLKARPRVPTA